MSAVVRTYQEAGLFERWPIIYMPTHTTGSAIVKIRVAMATLAKYVGLLLTRRIGLVHVHSASNASFWRKSLFVLLSVAFHRPTIFHLHGGGFLEFYGEQRSTFAKRSIRFVLDACTRIVVLSESWKKALSGIANNPNIVVIPNPAQRVCVGNKLDWQSQGSYVLFLNRISREKGIFDLLEALVRVRKCIPNVRLKCAGDSGLGAVTQRAAELGIGDCVEVFEWVQGDLKQELLENAAVYVLPSYTEGLPMGILEAMSAGLPIVSTRVGGIPDVIEDGVDGLLITPGDITALAEAIKRLLRDPSLRSSMGNAGRRKVEERYTPEKVLLLIEALYEELFSKTSRYGVSKEP